jgi:hypothetical protein
MRLDSMLQRRESGADPEFPTSGPLQYQLFASECAQAAHGVPYEPEM